MQKSKNESEKVPAWFAEKAAGLFTLYPNASMQSLTVVSWWRHLGNLPEEAVRRAFARAPRENDQPMWAPSAEFVRRLAESEAKTLSRPVPNYKAPCLPEPDLELPPDNPFYETLERFKRGEIPRNAAAKEIVNTVVNSIGGRQ